MSNIIDSFLQKTFKKIFKNVDDDIAKALSKKSAKDSAEVFKSATRSGSNSGKIIGDKNPLYVKSGGTIDKTYQEVTKVINNRDKAAFLSTERGLMESIEEVYSSTNSGTGKSSRRIKMEELEELKHKIKNKEGLNSNNATGSGNRAQRRIDEINSQKEAKERLTRERLAETADERLKYIQDELRNAGMGLNGVRPNAKEYSTKTLKGKMYDSETDYMKYMAAKEHDEAIEIFKLRDKDAKKFEQKAKNNPILNKMKGDRDGYDHITQRGLEANRAEAIRGASKDQMGLMDHMGYNKVPQKVTAGVGTFWLVNKLAEGNGQQTNAQLYGQQPY